MPYARNGDISVYYEVAGEGPPLVMLHANPCDHRMWMYQMAHFSTWFRVIAPDMRAYGRTDKPTQAYPFSALVNDVLAVCKQEDVTEGILAGASMGSKMAFKFLTEHPGIFKANIQVGGNAFRGSSYDDRIRGYLGAGSTLAFYREQHLKELFAPGFSETNRGKHLVSMILEDSENLSGEAIATLFQSFDNVDLASEVDQISIPTLIINGAYDNSLTGGKKTSELIPGAEHAIIEDAGHLCILEKPEEFDKRFIDFLRSHGFF
jgi:pimeloyl-ACP methyl ester carboxylesterase